MTDANQAYPALDAATFERMLLNPDVSDAQLRPYLVESTGDSGAFRPVVQVNPSRVEAPATEAAVAMSSLNGVSRWRRRQRYLGKIAGWTGVRIVSEGDSWFQYPFLLTDVIDWLSDPYAILSLDAAGDLLSDMVRQGELVTAVIQEKPDIVLLSGGGNDLLGGSHLSKALLPFQAGRLAEAYLAEAFEANMRVVLAGYKRLFARLAQIAPATPVLCHVYDYAIPTRGRWLGQPLFGMGIEDVQLQRDIIHAIVDRFHTALGELVGRSARVRIIDTRGTVRSDQWHDELHPTDAGYAAVAQLFAAGIADATGTAIPQFATEAAGVEADLAQPPGEAERAMALLAPYSEDALVREIGRRKALAEAGDAEIGAPVAVFPSSVEAAFPALLDIGARTLAEAGRTVFDACCAHGAPTRAEFDRAVRAGGSELIRHLAAVLAKSEGKRADGSNLIAATLLARRLDRGGFDTQCQRLETMADPVS